jgi:thiamine biosynthesis lipoprotein ApbE
VVSVTVLAGTAAWADALSKVPFVDPEAITEIAPAAALVVRADQSIECVGDFPIELAARPETRHR